MEKKPFYNLMTPYVKWHLDHYNIDGCCEAAKEGFAYIEYSWEGGRCDQCNKLVVEGRSLSLWKRAKLAIFH